MVQPAVGARVVVPLGSRPLTGIVVDAQPAADIAEASLKPIRQVLDIDAFVPTDVLALARWTAEYYEAGQGEMIAAVLPPKARGVRADAHKTMRVATITAAGIEALAGQELLTSRQREALALVAGAVGRLPTPEPAARGIGADLIGRLAREHLGDVRRERNERR